MIRTQCFQCQGLSLIPGQVTKSLQAMQHSQKRKNRIFFLNFIYLFLAVLDLPCCLWAFP